MKEDQNSKDYKTPQFQLVRQDALNKLFFSASGNGAQQQQQYNSGNWTWE